MVMAAPTLKDALVIFVECDDDTVVRARAVLELYDTAVLCLSSRQGAAELLQHHPDLLVVDVSLSDDALGLARDLRAQAGRVPTLALVESEAEGAAAREAGYDECVVKPVAPRPLLELMRTLLAAR
jgi:DNA-binding response OmpR family regulator